MLIRDTRECFDNSLPKILYFFFFFKHATFYVKWWMWIKFPTSLSRNHRKQRCIIILLLLSNTCDLYEWEYGLDKFLRNDSQKCPNSLHLPKKNWIIVRFSFRQISKANVYYYVSEFVIFFGCIFISVIYF